MYSTINYLFIPQISLQDCDSLRRSCQANCRLPYRLNFLSLSVRHDTRTRSKNIEPTDPPPYLPVSNSKSIFEGSGKFKSYPLLLILSNYILKRMMVVMVILLVVYMAGVLTGRVFYEENQPGMVV